MGILHTLIQMLPSPSFHLGLSLNAFHLMPPDSKDLGQRIATLKVFNV